MKFELLKSLKNKKNSILAIVFFLLCTLQLFFSYYVPCNYFRQ